MNKSIKSLVATLGLIAAAPGCTVCLGVKPEMSCSPSGGYSGCGQSYSNGCYDSCNQGCNGSYNGGYATPQFSNGSGRVISDVPVAPAQAPAKQ